MIFIFCYEYRNLNKMNYNDQLIQRGGTNKRLQDMLDYEEDDEED